VRVGKRIALLLGGALVVAVLVLLESTDWLRSLGGRLEGERLTRAHRSSNFADGKFRNKERSELISTSSRELLRRQFFGNEQRTPTAPVPVEQRRREDYLTPPASGLRATWIGWATVLLELDGVVVLTDPVWSDRCSPSTLVGPKRFHPPPIPLEQLPRVDAVVISHDHYDHLDMPAVEVLASRGTHFFVPLGVGAHLQRWGIHPSQVHDLDWNESGSFRGVRFTATPARHYSGRNPRYGNATLWSSWVIAGPGHRVFFSGDSGYSSAFRQIGEAHGPFDLALIKIGASDPAWVEIHMSPEQAVQTAIDVRARLMLPDLQSCLSRMDRPRGPGPCGGTTRRCADRDSEDRSIRRTVQSGAGRAVVVVARSGADSSPLSGQGEKHRVPGGLYLAAPSPFRLLDPLVRLVDQQHRGWAVPGSELRLEDARFDRRVESDQFLRLRNRGHVEDV
jgi:L-ascorbate metabolism protein UlaG (beta-lactamase superfamily)